MPGNFLSKFSQHKLLLLRRSTRSSFAQLIARCYRPKTSV